MENEQIVVAYLKSAVKPVSAGQIADATGVERKEVDKVMTKLKKSGAIESPRACYWQWKPE